MRQIVLPVVCAVLVLAGVLAALGCGGGGEEITSSNCGPVPAPLTGTWTMTINANELPPELANLQAGRYDMTFGPGHEHSVTPPNGNEFSYGPVCIDGDHIQFSEPPVGGVCTGSGKSVYSWEVVNVNHRLILETIEDECVFREVFLVAQAWREVPA